MVKEVVIGLPRDLYELAERGARLRGLTVEEFLKNLINEFYEENKEAIEGRKRDA